MVDLRPRGPAYAALVARHCRSHIAFYGEKTGVKAMRKHLDAYIARVPGTAHLRAGLIREPDPGALFDGITLLGELDTAERLAA